MTLRYTERLLTNDERPTRSYDYWVTGRGHFPFDMLRYDRCWPCTGEDAILIDYNQRNREPRSIHLRSYQMPTIGRWSSFLWSVGQDRIDMHDPTRINAGD
jgi:hypothetical protein